MKKNLFLLCFAACFLFAATAFSQTAQPDCQDASAIKKYLEQQGFEGTPVKIVGNVDEANTSKIVMDFAGLIISLEGTSVNMAEALETDIKNGASEGHNVMGIITKNENFCDNDVRKIIFNNYDKDTYDASINVHIWDDPNSENDLFFMRVNQLDFEKMGKN